VTEELFPRYSGLPNYRGNCSAWQIAIVIRNGGVAARVFVEELVVTAGNSDNRKAAMLQGGYDLAGLQTRQASHTFSPTFVLSCSKIGSGSPSAWSVWARWLKRGIASGASLSGIALFEHDFDQAFHCVPSHLPRFLQRLAIRHEPG
jgi:hypothetical protein